MTLPPPGWYPDPEQPTRKRWWSGATWTAGVQEEPAAVPTPTPAAAAEPSSDYVPMPHHPAAPEDRVVVPRPVGTKSSRAKQANFPSWVGLIIGALSFLYNPFALVSIPALLVSVFGLLIAISLKRSTGTLTGGFFAIGGIVLALITAAIAWPEIALFLDLRQGIIPDIPGIPDISNIPLVPTPFPSD